MKTSSISGNAVYKTLIFHGMLITLLKFQKKSKL